MEKFYTCEEVARRYRVEKATVWAWIRTKQLPAVRIGRNYIVSEQALESFEKKHLTIID